MKVQDENKKKTLKTSRKNKTIFNEIIIRSLSGFLPAIYIESQEAKFSNSEKNYFEPKNLIPASLLVKCDGKRKNIFKHERILLPINLK